MIVVDTNIIVYLHIEGEHTKQVEQLFKHDSVWAAPTFWRSEFFSVLALYLRKKILTPAKALALLEKAEALLQHHEYTPIASDIIHLISTSDCSAYDCEFVALAKRLNIPLITHDKKILKSFPHIAIKPSVFIKSH